MLFVFFNDTATTEIYTLSLHDALPICVPKHITLFVTGSDSDAGSLPLPWNFLDGLDARGTALPKDRILPTDHGDRKSTRLNSSHANISYAVFCLKKKNSSHSHTTYLHR